jgi:hypothetical protein
MLKRRSRDLGERSLMSHALCLFEANMKAGRREKALRFWTDSAVSRCVYEDFLRHKTNSIQQ